MKLYRFSPITSIETLLEAVEYTHISCNQLCMKSLGQYLTNAGNIGIFCHYNDEYEQLIKIRDQLVVPSSNPLRKYFELKRPITIPKQDDIPQTTYTHLYIRKPDIYRAQVGDVDFCLEKSAYEKLKRSIENAHSYTGARIFPRNDLDMIELFDPDVDALAYISTNVTAKSVHIKLSEETNL